MANEVNEKTRKMVAEMENKNFNGKEPLSIIAFLQEFKSICDELHIYDSAQIWLFKNYLNGLVESVIRACAMLQTKTARA